MPKISPLAAVDPQARIADDVEIGPFCAVGPDVAIGAGCRLINSVTLLGHVTLGRNNVLYPQTVIGGPPQDRKYKGAPTRVEIGDDNILREHVTIHRGTEKGGGLTRVGSNNFLMVNVHAGHDVQIGSGCTFANNVMLAGHVVVHDAVNMAGGVGVHHFVTVGAYAFIGGLSRIHHDVPPFCKVDGADMFRGVNVVGLRRAGFSPEDIEAIEDACKRLFHNHKPFALAMAEFDTMNGLNRHVRDMIEFLRRRDMGKHGRYLEGLRAR
jgi:UDP-N-acetylglucosamine acyltransferase